jgi:hypothetical protein
MTTGPNSVPRFTAEVSLYSTSNHYYTRSVYLPSAPKVYLTDYVDQACLGTCLVDCGDFCAGTSGSAKSGCISLCAAENADCEASCTRPGDPPIGGDGGPGPGGGACAPGTPCAGGCCPAGFPNCNIVIGGPIVCCPPGFPVARPVPFLGIRCFPF